MTRVLRNAAFFFVIVCIPLIGKGEASSASCSEVRIDLKGGSMSSLAVSDQSESALCYAYSATELVDAYRASFGDGVHGNRSSVAHAAALFHANNDEARAEKELDDSYQSRMSDPDRSENSKKMAQKLYEREKLDLKNSLYSPEGRLANSAELGSGEIEQTLREIKQNKFICSSHFFNNSEAEIENEMKPLMEIRRSALRSGQPQSYEPEMECALKNAFGDQLGDLKKIADRITEDLANKKKYVLSVIQNSCPIHIDSSQLPEPVSFHMDRELADEKRTEIFSQHVSDLLNGPKPQPIGIAFDRNIFIFPYASRSNASHAAVIVGRKMIGGVCNLLIRDSYGKSCTPPASFVFAPANRFECKNGQMWVPLSDMASVVDQMTWLPRPSHIGR